MGKSKKAVSFLMALALAGGYFLPSETSEKKPVSALSESSGGKIIGDIDGSGLIDVTDLTTVAVYVIGDTTFTDEELRIADADGNGKVILTDLAYYRQYITKSVEPGKNIVLGTILAEPENDVTGYIRFASETSGLVLLETENQKSEENPFYSPLSMYSALSVAAECAAGNTRTELLSALSADSIEELRTENSNIRKSFSDNSSFKISDSMWLNNKWNFRSDAVNSISEQYGVSVFERDFRDSSLPAEIKDWIHRNTGGMINPDVTVGDPNSEIMRIINALALSVSWRDSFDVESTMKWDFNTEDGKKIKCDFMVYKSECYESGAYKKIGFGDNYVKYGHEMENGLKMYFILPDEGVSVRELAGNPEKMAEIYSPDSIRYEEKKMRLYLPKFEAESKFDLVPAANALGIKEAFMSSGDFSAVTESGGAGINEMIQETKISVSETGVEAAAYSEMIVVSCSPASGTKVQTPYEIYLNRPFIYYIADSDDMPVFTGIVTNPLEK